MGKRETRVGELLLENARYNVTIFTEDQNLFHEVLHQVFVDAYGYAAPEGCEKPKYFGHAAHKKAGILHTHRDSVDSVSVPYEKIGELSIRINEAVRRYFEKTDKLLHINWKIRSEIAF